MEYLGLLVVIIVVGLLIIPTKKIKPNKDHYARPENCTCPEYTKWSMKIDYNCPVHGDWEDPLYTVEEIQKSNMSEREQACHDAGLYVNKLYRDKEK